MTSSTPSRNSRLPWPLELLSETLPSGLLKAFPSQLATFLQSHSFKDDAVFNYDDIRIVRRDRRMTTQRVEVRNKARSNIAFSGCHGVLPPDFRGRQWHILLQHVRAESDVRGEQQRRSHLRAEGGPEGQSPVLAEAILLGKHLLPSLRLFDP